MSIQAIAHVLEHSKAQGFTRLVLLAIANHADAYGMNAYPSIGKIAQEARVHRATVYRSLAVLEQSGEIEITTDGDLRQYRVVVAACDKLSHAATNCRSVRKRASITQPSLCASDAAGEIGTPLPAADRARGKQRTAEARAALRSA